MNVLAVLLAALGCAVIGWVTGAGVFALGFEILRARDLDPALDSPAILQLFRYGFALIAAGIGLYVLVRGGIRSDNTGRFLFAALAGLGGAALGHMLDAGGLAAIVSKDTYIFIVLVSSALLMAAAALIAIGVFERGRRFRSRAGRAIAGIGLSLLLIFAALVFDRRFSDAYERLGENKWSAWFMLRLPEGAGAKPDRKAIRVELRTDKGTTRGFASEWLDDNGRVVLRANVDLPDRTRKRTIVVALPGQPDLIFDLPFPANPKPMHGYGSWHGVDRIAEDGRVRAPRNGEDYAIRYMIR